jgi:hypothetical protein
MFVRRYFFGCRKYFGQVDSGHQLTLLVVTLGTSTVARRWLQTGSTGQVSGICSFAIAVCPATPYEAAVARVTVSYYDPAT